MAKDPPAEPFKLNFTVVKVLLRTAHDEHHDLVVQQVRERDSDDDGLIDIRLFDNRKVPERQPTKKGMLLVMEEAGELATALLDSGLIEGG